MTNDHMPEICSKLVPKLLRDEQKDNRVTILNERSARVLIGPSFVDNVITGTKHEHMGIPEDKTTQCRMAPPGVHIEKKSKMSKSKGVWIPREDHHCCFLRLCSSQVE